MRSGYKSMFLFYKYCFTSVYSSIYYSNFFTHIREEKKQEVFRLGKGCGNGAMMVLTRY